MVDHDAAREANLAGMKAAYALNAAQPTSTPSTSTSTPSTSTLSTSTSTAPEQGQQGRAVGASAASAEGDTPSKGRKRGYNP
jgi:hypothetical protein